MATVFLLAVSLSLSAQCGDKNCSFNGECTSVSATDGGPVCSCDSGWQGKYCEQLDLLPAHNGSGLSHLLHDPARRTSTWGGSVLWGDDGKYHMWYSEISRHCGIHRWVTNSVVNHAVSDGPASEWHFEPDNASAPVLPIFSHEPIAARAPTGEYVLFVTHYPGSAADSPTCNCTDGNSASGEPGCAGEVGGGANKTLYSYFTYASDPAGPWSPLVSLQYVQPTLNHTDLNLAPVIRGDGSLLAWTRWDVWAAKDWKDPSTWRDTGQAPDWDSPYGQWEGEDPSMWVDRKGRYHILSHNGDRGQGGTAKHPAGDCGRHLFSETGAAGTWQVAPYPKAELGGCAYPRVNVTFADGSVRSFYRRERPHLVLGADGFTPVALTTASIDSPLGPGVPGFAPPQRDASYTLVQGIRH